MSDIAPAAPSATILMLRDGPQGLEVFMVVRHHEIDFASGALVFPGGKADPGDFDDGLVARLDGAEADPTLRGIQVAAIREAFEECGILLARATGETALIDGDRLGELEPYRNALHAGELSMLEFAVREDLHLACDELTHYAHWITPENLPKRFDTHFYLAKAPADHLALHDGHESVDSVWITPAQAMADAESGQRTVIFPTVRNLAKLGLSATTEDAVSRAAQADVVAVLPHIEQREDGPYICIPPEAGYDISEMPVPRPPK